jgi:putative membrane protein
MMEFLSSIFLWVKALHVIAVIAFMAGMLYLPRLFVYHTETAIGSSESERFKVMERKLLRAIINPSLIAVWILGLTLAFTEPGVWHQGWLQVKFSLVVGLSAIHGLYSRWVKEFARDFRRYPQRVYRIWNEVPALFMIVIVILVVVKPF